MPDRQLISGIINHLIQRQEIPTEKIDQLQMFGKESKAYAGLINLLYNTKVRTKRHLHSQTMPREGDPNLLENLLYLRGEILKEYAEFLEPLMPEPAYSLIRFDYASFAKFCNERGLLDLLRHATGLYPVIDTHKTRALQFLPFYEHVAGGESALIGNTNWKLARDLLNEQYQQFKMRNSFQPYQSRSSMKQEDSKTSIGVRLCYILLTRSHEQMKQYISSVTKSLPKDEQMQPTAVALAQNRFEFWFTNYRHFIEEGERYYLYPKQQQQQQYQQQQQQVPLVYGLSSSGFEQAAIKLISLVGARRNYLIFDSSIKVSTQQPFSHLLTLIQKDNMIPLAISNKKQPSEEPLVNSPKFLLLAYMKVLAEQLGIALKDNQNIKQLYMGLATNSNNEEQIFNRLFYSEAELLQLYESGKIKQYPSQYIYSTNIMSQLLKSFIKNNPSKFVHNITRINILAKHEQLRTLALNKLIGDVYAVDEDAQYMDSSTPGESVLAYLQQMQRELVQFMKPEKNREHDLAQYVKTWQEFYKFYKQMSASSLLEKLQISKIQAKKVELPVDENCLNASQLVNPLQRREIYYYVVRKAARMLKECLRNYLKTSQKKSDHETLPIRTQINRWLQIYRQSSFKYMLLLSWPSSQHPFSEDISPELEQDSMKQAFEDHVWGIFAEALLVSNNQTRSLVESKPVDTDPKIPHLSSGGIFGKFFSKDTNNLMEDEGASNYYDN